MLRVISLVLVLYSGGAGAAASAWHIAAREAWVQESPVPPGTPFHDRQIHVTAAGDDRYEHLTLRLTPAQTGEPATQLSTSVDPRYQLLVIHSVRLARGTAVTLFTAAQISARLHSQSTQPNPQERALDPRVLISLALPEAKPGDLLEYDYTVQSRTARFAGVFAAHYAAQWSPDDDAPAQRLRVTWPAERAMQFKLSGGGAPRLTSQAGVLEVLWRDPPKRVTEADTPRWFEHRSTIQLSDFGAWSDVAALLAAQYGEPAAPAQTSPAAPQAAPMILNALRLVQSKVHPVNAADGPYLPVDPAQVLQRGFGDSRDLARVLAALLRRVGIDARVALGDTHQGALLASRLPSPFILDAALVLAHDGPTEYWLDPAAPGPVIRLSTSDTTDLRHVLLLAPSDGRIVTLPAPANDSRVRQVSEQFDLRAGNSRPATLTVMTQFHGSWAHAMRAAVMTQSPAQRQLNQIQSIAQDYPQADSVGDVQVEDLANGETLQLTARFTIPHPVGLGAEPHFDFFAEALTDAVAPRDETTRQLPLSIPWPLKLEQHITAALPANFTAAIGTVRIDTAAYRYQRDVHLRQGLLHIDHSYVTLSDNVQPQDYAKFLEANARVYQALGLRAQPAAIARAPLWDWLGKYVLGIIAVIVVASAIGIGVWRRRRSEP
jgi:hypothetical protein